MALNLDNTTVYSVSGSVQKYGSGAIDVSPASSPDNSWMVGAGDLIGTLWSGAYNSGEFVGMDILVPSQLLDVNLDIWKNNNVLRINGIEFTLFSGSVFPFTFPSIVSTRIRVGVSSIFPSASLTLYSPGNQGDEVRWIKDSSNILVKDSAIRNRSVGYVYSPISSSQHEISRLNAVLSGTENLENTGSWISTSGRGQVSSSYGQLMRKPVASRPSYYTKAGILGDDARFKKYIYTLNADMTGGYWVPATNAQEAGNYADLGFLVDANLHNSLQATIPVDVHGKIRDIKVWVELVHRGRDTGELNSGLKDLQISLVSPNVRFFGGYPIWNAPGAQEFLYDANPNLTGVDNLVGNRYNYFQPEVFSSGAFVIWDGHGASPAAKYESDNALVVGDWHEFDDDIDMRTVFWDSSLTDNPRSRRRLFPNASERTPGTPLDAQSALIDGLKPLNYYHSPSNFAARFYSGSFSIPGPSASLSGHNVPWFVDPLLSSGSLNKTIIGVPPDGWLTGDPNGLFLPWKSAVSSTSDGIWWGTTSDTLALAGNSSITLRNWGMRGLLKIGTAITFVDSAVIGRKHYAAITDVAAGGAQRPFQAAVNQGLENAKIRFSPALNNNFAAGTRVYLTDAPEHQQNGSALFGGRAFGNIYANVDGYGTVYAGDPRSQYIYSFDQSTTGTIPASGTVIGFTTSSVRNVDDGSAFRPMTFVSYTHRTLETDTNSSWYGLYYSRIQVATDEIQYQTTLNPPGPGAGITSSIGLVQFFSTTLASTGTVGSTEYALSETFNLGNRWGFSYRFVPPDTVYLIGGYTGTLGTEQSGNFIDVLKFSGSILTNAFRSGTISNAVADGGQKAIRLHGGFFVISPAPYSSTFYALVGGNCTSTLAITESAAQLYSSATVASVSWSQGYSYRYWSAATFYDPGTGGDPGGGGGCPARWVMLNTLGGMKRADEIVVGDMVRTRHETIMDEWGYYPVAGVELTTNKTVGVQMADGRYIQVSELHRFWSNGQWVHAKDLRRDEAIGGENPGIVDDVSILGEVEVVKITVDRAHTYQLDGLLSHNAKPLEP